MTRLYTIAPHLPFADSLAAGLLARAGGAPESLARMLVLLPTRRASRALREAFLRRSEGRPLLLPRMSPIGDVDEDELVLTFAGDGAEPGGPWEALAESPPAIGGLRRRLMLARLIMAFEARRGVDLAPDQAAWLAADLARLLDEIQTERRDPAALKDLVPDRFAAHWQDTLTFLEILTERWPGVLAEEGALDPAAARNRLLAAQAAAWRAAPPAFPVIAAGSTGSIPATADLLRTIATLEHGAVVLPGLDRDLDPAAWSAAAEAPSHPQYGLARLLAHLGASRDDVAEWEAATPSPEAEARRRLLSAALRPAEAPARRPGEGLSAETVSRALAAGIVHLECTNPREEAASIALVLREALAIPGKTAALVTPDRDLARRVAAALRRWNVEIDDSAGVPLAATPPVTFLRLVLDAAAEGFAPVPLLAALKHPLAAGGALPARFRAMVRALETAALRGPRPASGFAGIAAALPARYGALKVWLAGVEACFAPLTAVLADENPTIEALLSAHVGAAEALAAEEAGGGARRLWAGEAGEAAVTFLDELRGAARGFPRLDAAAYPGLFEALVSGAVVRPRWGTHPRLAILGPLEARLQHHDLTVLGSLNEGTWPASPAADPWMSRPMRREFGLPLAERRVGLSAHDFAQAAMAPELVLTRSLRQGGQPTRPSRWLLRIEAEMEGLGLFAPDSPWKAPSWRDGSYQAMARALDAAPLAPARRPAPRPPLAARPRAISVTRVELWRRDPYAVYAGSILKLRPLDPLDADPAAAEMGSALHAALADFLRGLGDGPVPADGVQRLMGAAEAALDSLIERPAVWAFWRPRIARIARWFVAAEAARRSLGLRPVALEAKGRMVIPAPAGDFALTGTADRIDRLADGALAVIDYKTGALPSQAEVALGFAPQLTLEAAMVEAGAFPDLAGGGRVTALEYWRLAGRDGGTIVPVKGDPAALIAAAAAGLAALVARYDDAATPYPATPKPSRAPRFNDYVQLARTQEWIGGP